MKRVVEFITKIFSKDNIKLLGRWNIDYCHNTINRKVDLSNEDHCGPCGQYKNVKNVEVIKPITESKK